MIDYDQFVFVKPVELARRLQVSLATVRAWTILTDIPHLKVGRVVRFNLPEVIEWLYEGGSLGAGKRTREQRAQSSSSSTSAGGSPSAPGIETATSNGKP